MVVSRVRYGTTVAPRDKPTQRETDDRLATAAKTFAATVAALGVARADAVRAFDRQLGKLTG